MEGSISSYELNAVLHPQPPHPLKKQSLYMGAREVEDDSFLLYALSW